MKTDSKSWIEKYASRLNEGQGDLGKLSADERKHLRMLIHEYELEQQLVGIEDKLSQGELPLDEVGEEAPVS